MKRKNSQRTTKRKKAMVGIEDAEKMIRKWGRSSTV
jgi:hypothetical protein